MGSVLYFWNDYYTTVFVFLGISSLSPFLNIFIIFFRVLGRVLKAVFPDFVFNLK